MARPPNRAVDDEDEHEAEQERERTPACAHHVRRPKSGGKRPRDERDRDRADGRVVLQQRPAADLAADREQKCQACELDDADERRADPGDEEQRNREEQDRETALHAALDRRGARRA